MKSILLSAIVTASSLCAYAQKNVITNYTALHSKLNALEHKEESLLLSAVYFANGKVNQQSCLDELNTAKLVKSAAFKSAIAFSFPGEDTVHYLPVRDIDPAVNAMLINPENKGKKALLSVRVFKDLLYCNQQLFFVVEKINFIR